MIIQNRFLNWIHFLKIKNKEYINFKSKKTNMKSFKSFINESTSGKSRYITEAVKKIKGGSGSLVPNAPGFQTHLDNLTEGDTNEVNIYLTTGKQLGEALDFEDDMYLFQVDSDESYGIAVSKKDWEKMAKAATKANSTPFKKHSDKPIIRVIAYDMLSNDGEEVECYWTKGDEDSDTENMVLHLCSDMNDLLLAMDEDEFEETLKAMKALK